MPSEDIKIDLTKTRSIFEWGDEIMKPILDAIYSITEELEQLFREVE